MAVSFGQQGSFGQSVTIATKVADGLNTDNLYFYSYNRETNTFNRIPTANPRMDANGYVHFTTELAGAIIISDGALTRR
jgi:hypothetical protein